MNKETIFTKDLISVIIPAYNVRDYLKQCVESVCNQTYKNLEIIIIDDGSNDGTEQLCDTFVDSRIKVIHQENRGLSGARNAGLDVANGEFISFIDSDDFIRDTMLQELHEVLIQNEADFSACAVECMRCDTGASAFSGDSGVVTVLNYVESIDFLCNKYWFNVWNKLYRHDIISELRYVEGVVCEDVGYMASVFERIKRTVYVDKPLYVYRVKREGSSGMTFDARKLPAIEEFERFITYLKDNGYLDMATEVRRHQLALIRSLYNETENEDKVNRKKMYKMYMSKLKYDNIWKKRFLSNIAFLLCPMAIRRRYQNDKQRFNKSMLKGAV
ncbi:MAG: glycosyltransferase family 2 protein [Acetatifactor sp.]|nr:glycosyltransferase family 2 protein [Acetatifactor sp.]